MSKNEIIQQNNTDNLLQQETIKIIKESQNLLAELIKREEANNTKNSKKTLSLKNLKEHQNILTNELQKLNNLEYVIAFVGTMKSGKSMTINAIVGQEILPSREFPMTTLPTLITHKPNQTEPTLTIQKIEPFNKLVEEIQTKLKDHNNLSNLQEIQDLVNEIKNNNIKFTTKYEGQENISKFLKEINDLMRVAKELSIEPPYEQYTDVDDLPRIEVEFYHLKKHNKVASTAKLTLLDTPGPDEVKQSALLKKIFQEQLKRASAVTLVVDYTKMNNESDAEVKEQVKEVANMIGKKHLFVLLNKFDQRNQDKDETESREEAKQLIYDDILKGKINKENVYPISSKSAFYANRGLCELEKNSNINSDLPWRKSFGVEVLGRRWEKYINDNEEVIEACNETWKDSFFEEPLNNIIETVHSEASSLVLDAPLGKIELMLQEFYNAFNTQENAYEKDIQALRNTVIELEKSVQILQNITEEISKVTNKKVNSSKKKLQKEIVKIIENLSTQIKNSIESSIEEREKNKEKEDETDKKWYEKEIWAGGFFGGKDKKETDKEYFDTLREKGEITFIYKDYAKNFIKSIMKEVNTKIIHLYKISEQEFNHNVLDLSEDLNILIKNELDKIIQEISKKFGNEVFISLPTITIKNQVTNYNSSTHEFIEKGKEFYKEEGNGWFNSSLNWLNNDWGLVEKSQTVYKVTQKNTIKIITAQLENHSKSLTEQTEKMYKKEISEPLNKQISLLLKKLDGYKAEQFTVLEEREDSEIDLNDKKRTANDNKKRTKKLKNRVLDTKKQMSAKSYNE